ncbi:MAG: hypothetical protein ACOYNY_44340 [Caldilineaceae bacterium]
MKLNTKWWLLTICLLTQLLFGPQIFALTTIGTPALYAASLAQETPPAEPSERVIQLDQARASKIGTILLVFLVLSVVFEVALQPIFEWRIFETYLADKGFKTPIKLLLAVAVFWSFDLDIFTNLLNVMTDCRSGKPDPLMIQCSTDATFWGRAVTALLIAGGSSGVHEIFIKLNIRKDKAETKDKTATTSQASQPTK